MKRTRRPHSIVIDQYAGIPVTQHDLQATTPVEERQGYRLISLAAAAGAVVFLLLWIFGVSSTLEPGLWASAMLLCLSVLLAYAPLAWGPVARQARPARDVVGHLNPARLESFWYERGVHDQTPETVYDERPPRGEDRPHP